MSTACLQAPTASTQKCFASLEGAFHVPSPVSCKTKHNLSGLKDSHWHGDLLVFKAGHKQSVNSERQVSRRFDAWRNAPGAASVHFNRNSHCLSSPPSGGRGYEARGAVSLGGRRQAARAYTFTVAKTPSRRSAMEK